MKKILLPILLFSVSQSLPLDAGAKRTVPSQQYSKETRRQGYIETPEDNTDIYAIPFDTSETEEFEAEEEYNKLKRHYSH